MARSVETQSFAYSSCLPAAGQTA